jgi:malate dehydrogenase (oxaloacetate-decarboxylating)(NADP+)
MTKKSDKDALREDALAYHQFPRPGKIAIQATKPMSTQRDLALAYSPGVAFPCEEIEKDPGKAYDYTSKGNLVAVISNGTAVLGLGSIGALASKPVMEGKAVLFKKFAGLDAVDIEIDEEDIDKVVDIVASMEPTFGGINLEDFKAPECFEIERRLRARMKIPVFHDDQHGTAIIVTAAFTNWIRYSGRDIKKIKLVANGAGAAAIACLNLLVEAGLDRKNIIVCDRIGVVYEGRNEGMDPEKEKFAVKTDMRSLEEAIQGADVFLGLSAARALPKEWAKTMAKSPLIMALANPTPEILPEEVREVRDDAIVCTGRSDYPNQVNNVLCFPFLFRGALDVGATAINEDMKLACVQAIAELARKEPPAEVTAVYANEVLEFGPEYLIPKPFDPRLIVDLPIAVAKAAMKSGVATRPIQDFEAYKQKLQEFFIRSKIVMRPVMARAQANPKRVVFCDGEEEKILQAVQTVIDDGLAKPMLIGRHKVVETRIKRLALRMKPGKDFELIDPDDDPRYKDYWETYHRIMERRGVTPSDAKAIVRTNTTVIGALMVYKGDAESMICGAVGHFKTHQKHLMDIIGLKPGVETAAAMNGLVLPKGTFFICDTQINPDPTVSQMIDMTLMAVEEVKRFGIVPKVAMLSHSNFGSQDTEAAQKMRVACAEIRRRHPALEIEGEMQGDSALSEEVRERIMPGSVLKGQANLLMMPNVEAASIAYNMLRILTDAISIGPVLLGTARPVYILTPSMTPRGVVNMAAIASVAAQSFEEEMKDENAQRGVIRHL